MAYKVFQNGFPLPASDLNNYLMNQSVIVFASASARSSTLPTPTEGMITYLEDTNALETYNGSAWVNVNDNTNAIPKSTVTAAGDLIVGTGNATVSRLGVGASQGLLYVNGTTPAWLAKGTTDQVLSTNSSGNLEWVTAASAGEVLISSTTASSTAISLSSIPSTYQHLRIVGIGLAMSGTAKITLAINGGTAATIFNDDTQTGIDFILECLFYKNAVGVKRIEGFWNGSGTGLGTGQSTSNLYFPNTAAINSISISNSNSPLRTFTAGTVELWGVK